MRFRGDSHVEYSYSQLFLKPQKCMVDSRSQCSTEVNFGGKKFIMPIYPANMKSVVDEETCIFFAERKWFYTMHRFDVDNIAFVNTMQNLGLITSISVGINDYEEIKSLPENIDYITIDVANAWSDKVKDKIKCIKDNLPNTFIIVGNVATKEAVLELQDWGASAIKVGIAGGKVCITKNKTGFHRPMATTVSECCEVANVPIIADGGIEHHGDIAKAISLGATMVMAGFLFAGYDVSAGDVIEIEDKQYKEYFGSASKYNKKEQKNIEGKKILIPYRGHMDNLILELIDDLRSSISYSGGDKLFDLRAAPKIFV